MSLFNIQVTNDWLLVCYNIQLQQISHQFLEKSALVHVCVSAHVCWTYMSGLYSGLPIVWSTVSDVFHQCTACLVDSLLMYIMSAFGV